MAPFAGEPPIGCRAPRQTAHGGGKRNKKSSKKATQASRSCVKVHRGTALSGKCRCQAEGNKPSQTRA